jgi:hypothetical protein
MINNIGLMALLILNGDVEALNNWIEIGLWVSQIAACCPAENGASRLPYSS